MDKFTDISTFENRQTFDSNQLVNLSDIQTTKGEVSKLNTIVHNYVKTLYAEFGYRPYSGNVDINVNGLVINTEYLDKMVNNYTIYTKFIRLKNFKTFNDLLIFISTNLDKIYRYDGYYFKEVMTILNRTISMGNTGEQFAIAAFIDAFADKLSVTINVEKPTLEEDLKGIDGKFNYGGKDYTIQIKPMDSYKIYPAPDDYVLIKTKGSLSLATNYLVTYDLNDKKVIISRNKGIVISGDTFKVPSSSVVKY